MARRERRRRQERRREHSKRRGWQTRHSVITGASIAATATLGIAGSAQAASYTYYVGSNADTTGSTDCLDPDNTTCTLRDAVSAANINSGYTDYVVFTSNVSGAVTLGGTDIPITDPVYVYGRGADVDTVSGDDTSRIFDIQLGTDGDPVGISGLTLTHGYAGNGGAIQNSNALLRIGVATFSGNNADGLGGAIYVEANGYDIVEYSTFSDNHAAQGGAVYANTYWGTLRSSTFNGNSAEDGYGGAIGGDGGYLIDSTVSGNYASVSGGGVSVFTNQFGLYGTILANNSAGASNPDLYSANGGAAGFDLVEDPGTSGIGVLASVITGQDPQLGGLQNNGGSTPTLKPAASSPVVDQSYSYSYYDQRTSDRRVDNPNRPNAATGPYAAVDIGSVELTIAEGPQATPSTPAAPPIVHKKKKCKKKKHRSAVSAKKKKCKKKKKRSTSSRRGFRFASPPESVPRWPGVAHNAFRLGR